MTRDDETDENSEDESSQCQPGHEPSTGRNAGPWWDDRPLQQRRLAAQVAIILNEIPGAAVYPPGQPEHMEYLYIEGQILVRDADLDRVQRVLPGRVVDALVNGVTAYSPDERTTTEALELIDNVLGVGVATPNHILYVTPASCCPANEPVPADAFLPNPALGQSRRVGSGDQRDGLGSCVAVVDTGLIPSLVNPQHFWLTGVTGDEEFFDPEDIGPYVGHGTFVSGVLREVAPAAEVHVYGFLTHGGAIDEGTLVKYLDRAAAQAPDVISMSAGCTTRDSRRLMSFEALYEERLRDTGTVLVAAAGNNADRQRFWPAAFGWAVSVGALSSDGSRAPFSDFGGWVDVFAAGVDVVNAYPNGRFVYKEPPKSDDHEVAMFDSEMAVWSGTSFATPLVAGMIAARCSRTGQSGRQAADSLLRIARAHATPGVGAVAEPTMTFLLDPGSV